MRYSFVCYGGSGSTFLIRRLERRARFVHVRPETYWLPKYFPRQDKSATGYDQQLTDAGYDDRPTPASAAGFAHRTHGFKIDLDQTIFENLRRYHLHTIGVPRTVTMYSRAPMLGFFTRLKGDFNPRDVVFVVRHPMHQYCSLTKPERHLEFVAGFGGQNTEGGVRFFAEEWNRFVGDALDSGCPVARYEFMSDDVGKLDEFPRNVLAKWTTSRRNPLLSPANEDLLQRLTAERYKRIYTGGWNV